MSMFDIETDDQIKEFMQGEGKYHSAPYVELGRRLPKFSPKQIRHRWKFNSNRIAGGAVNRIRVTHCIRKRPAKKPKIPGTSVINFNVKQPGTNTHVNPSAIVFFNVPHLQLRPSLPTLIPDFQPEISIPKMMPIF
ncbi:1317_t:CDS:2 [Funneliformis geosporum]|uniref:571_t:CDS:1 n=1 Tax=Funneliformis geosporum TaxID=1117311 RepID=A0A9W4X4P0_9GLOM|nr:571_t:CDS:2 [Funneliformis geosporum]CAI2186512.1 1317_t:CDS:2 [Funneliformis geosporum]